MVKTWQDFLTKQLIDKNKQESKAEFVIDRARKIIWKRNCKVLEFGKNILLSPSDALMHQLRIEGKKLRYLLEFFSSLFADEKIQLLIKKHKQLQDNLGEFNDLVVQQNTLKSAVKSMTSRTKNSKGIILSIGILIGKLHSQQESVKSEFAQTFIAFSSAAVQKINHELFYQSPKGV